MATEEFLQALREEVDREIDETAQSCLEAPRPAPASVTRHVYSEEIDPTSERFAAPPRLEGGPKTMVDLLNACLRDEMERDPRIVVFGEDVADCSRADHLSSGPPGSSTPRWPRRRLSDGRSAWRRAASSR